MWGGRKPPSPPTCPAATAASASGAQPAAASAGWEEGEGLAGAPQAAGWRWGRAAARRPAPGPRSLGGEQVRAITPAPGLPSFFSSGFGGRGRCKGAPFWSGKEGELPHLERERGPGEEETDTQRAGGSGLPAGRDTSRRPTPAGAAVAAHTPRVLGWSVPHTPGQGRSWGCSESEAAPRSDPAAPGPFKSPGAARSDSGGRREALRAAGRGGQMRARGTAVCSAAPLRMERERKGEVSFLSLIALGTEGIWVGHKGKDRIHH